MRPSRLQALLLQAPVLVVSLVLLLIPAVLFLLTSISAPSPFQLNLGGWRISNYRDVFSNAAYRTEAVRSVELALQTTLWSTLGGFVLAYWMVFRARRK